MLERLVQSLLQTTSITLHFLLISEILINVGFNRDIFLLPQGKSATRCTRTVLLYQKKTLKTSVILLLASHAPYKWDYWPHDDVRAECRFVGLTNLGATCYLASTIQQLYMIPEARQAVFTAKVRACETNREQSTLGQHYSLSEHCRFSLCVCVCAVC